MGYWYNPGIVKKTNTAQRHIKEPPDLFQRKLVQYDQQENYTVKSASIDNKAKMVSKYSAQFPCVTKTTDNQ